MFLSLPLPLHLHLSTRDDFARNVLLSHSDHLSSLFKSDGVPEFRSSLLSNRSLTSQPPGGGESSSPESINGLKVTFSTNEQCEPSVKIPRMISVHGDLKYQKQPRKTPRERRIVSDASLNFGQREFEHLIFPSPQKALSGVNHPRYLNISHPCDVFLYQISNIVSVSMLLAAQGVGSTLFYVAPNNKEIKFISSSVDTLFEKYFGSDALRHRSFPYVSHVKAFLSYCRHAVLVGNLFLNLDEYARDFSNKSHLMSNNYTSSRKLLPICTETDSGAGREVLLQLRSMSQDLLQSIRTLSKGRMDRSIPTSPFRIYIDFKVRLRLLSSLKSAVFNSRDKLLLRGNKLFSNIYASIPPSLQALRLFKAALTPLLRILSRQLGIFIPANKSVDQSRMLREGELSSVLIIDLSENNENDESGEGDLSCYSLDDLPEFFNDDRLNLSVDSIKRCAETVKMIRNNSPSLALTVCPSSVSSTELSMFHETFHGTLRLQDIDRVHESILKLRKAGLCEWKQKQDHSEPNSPLASNDAGTNTFLMSTVLDRFALSTAEQALRNTVLVRDRRARIAEELEAARLASVESKQREFERITKDVEDAVRMKKALRQRQEEEDKDLISALAAADKALANPLRGTAWDGEKESLYAAARIEILKTFGDKVKAYSTRPEDRISVEGNVSSEEAILVALDSLSALGASGIRQAASLAQQLNIAYPSDQNRRRAAAPKDSLNIFREETVNVGEEKSETGEQEDDVESNIMSLPFSAASDSINVLNGDMESLNGRDDDEVRVGAVASLKNESDSQQRLSERSMGRGDREGRGRKRAKKTKSTQLKPEYQYRSAPTDVELMSSEELDVIWAGVDPVLPLPLLPSALASYPNSPSGFILSLQRRFLGSSDVVNERRDENSTGGESPFGTKQSPLETKSPQQKCPLSVVIQHGLLAPLARHIALVDEAGALLVLLQGSLCSHYKSLHQWMLLGSGHCVSKFMDDLSLSSMFKMSVSVALDSFSRSDDSIVFNRARARAVSLANKTFERAQSGDGEDIRPDGFKYKIASITSRTKRKTAFDGKKWWSPTALDIVMSPEYDKPLGGLASLVLTPSILSLFGNVHMFLLSLRRTKALLSNSWTILRRQKNYTAMDAERALHLFIFDSFLALNALDRFLFLEVIDNGFKALLHDTERAITLSEIKDNLDRFLRKCLLSEGHIAAIHSIQEIILNVCSVVEGTDGSATLPVSELSMIVSSHKKLRLLIDEGSLTRPRMEL